MMDEKEKYKQAFRDIVPSKELIKKLKERINDEVFIMSEINNDVKESENTKDSKEDVIIMNNDNKKTKYTALKCVAAVAAIAIMVSGAIVINNARNKNNSTADKLAEATKEAKSEATIKPTQNTDETATKEPAKEEEIPNFTKCEYGKEYQYDLNCDGTKETILCTRENKLINKEYSEYNYTVDVKINDITKKYDATYFCYVEEYYFITDLDKSDKFREICFVDPGPSDDPYTTVITYNNDKIIDCDGLESYPDKFTYNDDGTFEARYRLGLFQTWWAPQKYMFDSAHKVTTIANQEYIPEKIELTLIKEYKFYKEASKDSEVVTIKPQKCYSDKTDNKKWCHITFEDGSEGWIALKDFETVDMSAIGETGNLSEVFDGRVLAD